MTSAPLQTGDNSGLQDAEGAGGSALLRGSLVPGAHGQVLGLGALLGIAGERLVLGGASAGFVLWVTLLGLAALALQRRTAPALLRTTAGWVALAVAAAAIMAWRDSPAAILPMLLILFLAAGGALLRSAGTRLFRARPLDLSLALASVPARAFGAALPLLASTPRPAPGRLRACAAWGRGLLLALPLLLLFGALFSSADRRFGQAVQAVFDLAPNLPGHVALALVLAWMSAGLLTGLLPHRPLAQHLPVWTPPRFGREETLSMLGLLCILFLLFVGLQLGYLFGGTDYIEQVPGLTVAMYARRGFFELLSVALLTLALLLALQPLAEDRVFRVLGRVLAACVFVLLISALQRLWLYVDSFGLTVSRVAALAALAWVSTALILFLATTMQGRPRRFVGGAVLAAVVVAFGLAFANPEGLVARVNLARMQDAVTGRGIPEIGVEGDLAYLQQLGADAVPPLLDALPGLPAAERCLLASSLLNDWNPQGYRRRQWDDWRTWHFARARASRLVDAHAAELIAYEAPCLPEGIERQAFGSARN